MKNKLIIILSAMLGLYIITSIVLGVKLKNARIETDRHIANEKAMNEQLDTINSQNRVFQYTIDELKASNNEKIQELLKTAKDLKIKDKKIQELANIQTIFYKTDTLTINDTIFINNFALDTTIGDEWMNHHLSMKYPNYLSLESTMTSDKNVVISKDRETVNPPKKFFLCRWFQRKHDVIKVHIEEKNPNIQSERNLFIQTFE